MRLQIGYHVVLNVPGNRRLHGARAVIRRVMDGWVYVSTQAAATGQYRAMNEEIMYPLPSEEERRRMMEIGDGGDGVRDGGDMVGGVNGISSVNGVNGVMQEGVNGVIEESLNGALVEGGEPGTLEHTPVDVNVGDRYRRSEIDLGMNGVNGGYMEEGERKVMSAQESGYTGNVCDVCGGVRLKRCGVCELCEDCGATSGCG